MDTKKVVLKLYLLEDRDKKKVMKAVCSLPGVESLTMDTREKKLTVIGYVDPVDVVKNLRKLCKTDVLTVGPAKEPAKKKDEPNKDKQIEEVLLKTHRAYHTYMWPYYPVQRAEDYPNACVIC